MIREKETYPIVKEIRPWLFWYECRFCGKEYKREKMYQIEDYKECRASNSPPTYTSYCCSHCADSKDKVKELIKQKKLEFLSNKPPSPGKQPKELKESDIID